VRLLVGTIIAKEHRGRVRAVMTANTGTQVYMDLDEAAAREFLGRLEAALRNEGPSHAPPRNASGLNVV
jgi:hypothetical protein